MIALNIVLMSLAVVALACALAWAIVSDRRSKRAAGGPVHPADAPLDRDLVLPDEMRGRPAARLRGERARASRSSTA
jgi:hypothetical protein